MTWWNALPNTSIDVSSSSAQIFAQASHILTDGISYLAEWPLATGKPAIFLEHKGHWEFSPLGEVAAAVAAAKEVAPGMPIVATLSFDTNLRTMMGVKPAQAITEIAAMGVRLIGANNYCSYCPR